MTKTFRRPGLAFGLLLASAATQAAPVRVTDGLVGEWHLTPVNVLPQQRVSDTSGYGRNGLVYGGSATSYGWTGQSVNLAGDKYVSVPNSPNLNFGAGSFTLAAYIRFNDISSGIKTIIDNRGSNGAGYSFATYDGNRLLLQIASGTGSTSFLSDGSVPLATNRWHHVAVTVNRTISPIGITFYIDGYSTGSIGGWKGIINNVDRPFYIGGNPYTPTQRFNGLIDEVLVYNRALPDWEVGDVMNPGKPVFTPSYWSGMTRVLRNNCYNYANNKDTSSFAQPGRAAGATAGSLTCAAVRAAAIADGLEPMSDYPGTTPGPGFKAGLALVVAPGYDFHWYRLDRNGYWTHKPGGTQATNLDNAGQVIFDPRTADRGPYTDFCGFFQAWSDLGEGNGHENIR